MLLSSGIGFIVYTSFQHGRTREHPTKSFDRVGYIGTWIEATQSAQVLMSQTNLTCEFVVNGLTYIILLYIILLTYIIYIVNKFALLAWFLSLLTYNKKKTVAKIKCLIIIFHHHISGFPLSDQEGHQHRQVAYTGFALGGIYHSNCPTCT